MTNSSIPEGFKQLSKGYGFTDSISPLYEKNTETGLVSGLLVEPQHLNLMGICHGGVMMVIADVSCARNIVHQLDEPIGLPTISLNFDFVRAAKLGDWLESKIDTLEVKRRLGFAAGKLYCDDKVICRFSGTFYINTDGTFKVKDELLTKLRAEMK